MRLFLVRHGQTVWNDSNRAQGHTDISLDETGGWQAQRLAGRLADEGIQRILCSDLSRAIQSAAPTSRLLGIEPEFRKELRERTFGTMEGSDFTALHTWMTEEGRRLGIPSYEVRPPQGESMMDVWNRLSIVEAEIWSEARSLLIVSHGGALAQLLAKLIKGGHETPRAFRFSNCGVTTLNRRPDGSFLLDQFNDVSHLEGGHAPAPVD